MGTDEFLNQISTLIFGWEIVDFATMINQKSTSQPQFNQKSTNCQPNFNHFSTLTFQLQTWLIFGRIVVEKLIFGWSLFQNQRFLNQISTLRMVEESWGSTLIQHWKVDLCPLGYVYNKTWCDRPGIQLTSEGLHEANWVMWSGIDLLVDILVMWLDSQPNVFQHSQSTSVLKWSLMRHKVSVWVFSLFCLWETLKIMLQLWVERKIDIHIL